MSDLKLATREWESLIRFNYDAKVGNCSANSPTSFQEASEILWIERFFSGFEEVNVNG
jgi:hypothetical protein